MTPEQRAEFEALNAASAAGGMTPAQQAEFAALNRPETEYSTGQAMSDVQLSAEEGVNQGAEFMADVGMFPTRMMLRANQGFMGVAQPEEGDNWYSDPFKRFWKGFSTEPNIEGVTIGDVTHEMFNPDELTRDQYQIPEGEGPAWLDPAKRGAKLGTEMLTTAPLAGPKYIGPAVKSVLPATIAGVSGREIDKALGGEGDTGELIGVVSGALAADPASLKSLAKLVWTKMKVPPEKLVSFVRKPGSVAGENLTNAQLRGGLAELLRNVYPDDPKMVTQTLNDLVPKVRAALDSGELGSLGQILDDPGLLAMEKQATLHPQTGRQAQHALDLVDAQISEKALDPITDIAPTGSTQRATVVPGQQADEAAQAALARTSDEAAQIEDAATGTLVKAKAAQEASEQAAGAIPPSSQTSPQLAQTLEKSSAESLSNVRKAFGEVGGSPITADAVRGSVEANFLKGLNKNDAAMFKKAFSDTFATIDKLEGEVTIDTLSNIISQAVSEANMISKGSKSGTALQHMSDFQEALYEAIEAGGGNAAARRKASQMYRAHMERYGPKSQIGKAMAGDAESFSASMLTTGDKGLGKLRRIVQDDPQAKVAVENSLRSLFKQRVLDPETGALKPTALKAFLNEKTGYGEHLKSFPGFRAEIDDMLATVRTAEGAATDMKTASATAEALRKSGADEAATAAASTPAQFAAAGDDVPAIIDNAKKLMRGKTGKDRLPALTELVDSVGDNVQAKEDLRRAFMDSFENTVTKDGKLTKAGYDEFKRNKDVYLKSGLFSADELQRVEDGLVEGQKLFLHENAKRLAKLPAEKQRLAGTLAALGGAKLGAYSFGSPLIGAALGRKAAVSWLDSITVDQAKKIAFDLSTNPQKFVDIFEKLDKQALTEMQGRQALKDLLARVASASITGEDE